jgi:hypothetical protein
MFTMVAEQQKLSPMEIFIQILMGRIWKGVLKLLLPDPLDLVALEGDMRHIVSMMTCLNTLLAFRMRLTDPGINHHPPAPSRKRLLIRLDLVSLYLSLGEDTDRSRGPKTR